MISLSTKLPPQGVVHSLTAYAFDSNTLPPPTSPLLTSLPPSTQPPSSTLPVRMLQGTKRWEGERGEGRGREAARKPDNQEAVTSGPR